MKVFCLAILVVTSLVGHSRAVAIVDDFNDGNNVGWTDGSPLSGFGAPTTYTYPGGNTYNIKIGASPSPGTLGASRGGSYRGDATYTDFGVKVDVLDWTLGGGTSMVAGLLARVHDIGLGTTDGYSLSYGTTGGGRAYLSKIINEAPTTLMEVPLALTSGTGYQFYFTGTGADLTGQIFALSDFTTPLVTLSFTDASYASGVNALLVFDSSSAATANHTPSARFDNFASDVSIQPGPLGDYNGDLKVDGADYVVWRKGLGSSFVQSDYNLWRSHFGEGSSSGAGAGSSLTGPAAPVPEPATLALLMAAAALFCAARRQLAR